MNNNKNIIIALCCLSGVLIVALVAVLAFNYGKGKGQEEVNLQAANQVSTTAPSAENNAEPASSATSATSATSLTSPAPAPAAPPKEVVYGDLYGTVGGQSLSPFMLEKNGSGYYDTGGARRTLKVVSRGNGHMVVKAYLRGKYIGQFKGRYSAFGDRLTLYEGTFYSSRGGGLAFDLMNPLD